MPPDHADHLLAAVTADIDQLTPGAVTDLPATELDDRELVVHGFARRLRALRFELARRRDHTTAATVLEHLTRRAHHIDDTDLITLTYLLNRHHRWLTGRFDTVDELINLVRAQLISPRWSALDDLYSAFYLNTAACYREAMDRLHRVEQTSPDAKDTAEFWIGMNLAHTAAAWRFWNRNESADYRYLQADTALVEDLRSWHAPGAAQSTAQLLLAAGVFYLHRRNHQLAHRYLGSASDAATGRLAPRLAPRIASALALACYYQGQHVEAANHHRRALSGLREHAGPAGWQLRLVAYQVLAGGNANALALVRQIRAQTQAKKEVAYNIWAGIYELELLGTLDSDEACELFTTAERHAMTRACEYMIEHRSSHLI